MGQSTAKTQGDPEPSCHFQGAGGKSRAHAGPLHAASPRGGPPSPHASPPDPSPPPGGAPVSALAPPRYTLSCDPPLASGQCLVIRVLEPWSATKGGQKGVLLLSTTNAALGVPDPVTDAGSHPEERIRKCKFFKGLPLSPCCPSLDATHSSLWGKAPDCKGEQVASCFHFRLKSSDSPALKKQNAQPAGAL